MSRESIRAAVATRTVCLFLVIAATVALGARPALAQTWARTYGGIYYDGANSIVPTLDGGFAVAGSSISFGVGYSHDVWVLKLDDTGAIEWQRAYGGGNHDIANSIVQTSDGGFAVAGYVNGSSYTADFWVLKLSSSGEVQWQWAYGGTTQDDSAYSIVQTSDGGYAVAGYTNSFGAGSADFWVLKLSSAGGIQWQRAYGGFSTDIAHSIVQTADGSYVVAGQTYSFGAGGYDVWLLKLNSDGDILWQKTYGGTNDDVAYSLVRMPDGGYVVAGGTVSFGAGGWDVWTLRLDDVGEVVWASLFGGVGTELANAVSPTTDGGCVIAGYRGPVADSLLTKFDSTGVAQWVKVYGGSYSDAANSIVPTPDGGYAVAGSSESFGAGGADAWILKLNGLGDIGGTCSLLSPGGGLQSTQTGATVQTQCQE